MKFPLLFRRENSKQAQLEAQEQVEKLLAESMRTLSQLLSKAADLVESQRLSRNGYGQQERFLERLDEPGKPGRENT